jgi:hypothetical protein
VGAGVGLGVGRGVAFGVGEDLVVCFGFAVGLSTKCSTPVEGSGTTLRAIASPLSCNPTGVMFALLVAVVETVAVVMPIIARVAPMRTARARGRRRREKCTVPVMGGPC